jgi:hypothetical protein
MEAGTIPSELGKLVQLTTLYSMEPTHSSELVLRMFRAMRRLSHLECICPNVRQSSVLF